MKKIILAVLIFWHSSALAGPADVSQVPAWANLYGSTIEHSNITGKRIDSATSRSLTDALSSVSTDSSQTTRIYSRSSITDSKLRKSLVEEASEPIPDGVVRVRMDADAGMIGIQQGSEQLLIPLTVSGTTKSKSSVQVIMSAAATLANEHWSVPDGVSVDFDTNTITVQVNGKESTRELEDIPIIEVIKPITLQLKLKYRVALHLDSDLR